MDILTRACWFASWCGAGHFKVAKRRWLEDVVMGAIATCRAPDIVWQTLGLANSRR
jgi:hypothetical protein